MWIWTTFLIWLADIAGISLCLAIFEILLERQHGWGGRLSPAGWGKKLFEGTVIAEACEKSYLTVYHVVMFAIIVPSILYAQSQTFIHSGLCREYSFCVSHIALFLFLSSIWFAILVIEDALWFAMNWYYPDSWKDLLLGRIWWHTKWVSIGNIKLPRFYVTTPVVAVSLLAVSLSVH